MTQALADLAQALKELQGGRDFCAQLQRALVPLEAYDARTGSDLTRTLRLYVEHGGNLAATAEQLFLHRNSVLYRLQRIEEISGIDARAPRTRLILLVAFTVADSSFLDVLRWRGSKDENQHAQ